MRVSAIVLAGGKGERLKSRFSKPLIRLKSKPIIAYSLIAFSKNPKVKEIIVVVNALNKKSIFALIKKQRINKVRHIVLGGKERQDSVYNGLKAVSDSADLVLIHDGGRPFIDVSVISKVIAEAAHSGAAIVGVPVKSTIKSVKVSKGQSVRVSKTLDRSRLWEIQTPQVFKKDLILRAFRKFGKASVTDDATLVEKLGVRPRLVLGSYNNIKVTTPEDLIIARTIAKKWKTA
jgi:2-C-methyl-D-erythritol 4-phosphate cytidylyltransferase